MKLDPECPVIENLKQAIALGQALSRVLHYDAGWAERVYQSSPVITYQTGQTALNNELQSMWYDGFTTIDERRAIVAEFVKVRLT